VLECEKNHRGLVKVLDRTGLATLAGEQVVVEQGQNVLGRRREMHVGVAENVLIQLEKVARDLLL
jgi:hypothetical protein